jgi:pimeloyl-ACP methyl ester carboxylesterase
MPGITHRTIGTNGIQVHIAEAGEGPLVVLVHGWPETWYSWRHQLPALAAAGYHAVAPDVRGYGHSDRPHPIEAYSMKELLADHLGLLDALGAETAVIVGHDWGAGIAWNAAALHPERHRAVVGMSVPFRGRPPLPPTQLLGNMFAGRWFYMLYFQEPGVAEAELEADIPRTMRTILAGAIELERKPGDGLLTGVEVPQVLPGWLSEDDVAYVAAQFAASGFRGGLNRYRNMDRDWEELPALATARIQQPALFITGDQDPVHRLAPADGMKETVPRLAPPVILPGAGHWVQQEKPAEVNDALLRFLSQSAGGSPYM